VVAGALEILKTVIALCPSLVEPETGLSADRTLRLSILTLLRLSLGDD